MASRRRRSPAKGRPDPEPRSRGAAASAPPPPLRATPPPLRAPARSGAGRDALDRLRAGGLRVQERVGRQPGEGPLARLSQQVVFVGLLVSVVLLALLTTMLHYRNLDNGRAEDARGRALAAAPSHLEEIYSYDYRTYDEDAARARDLLVGPALAQYEAGSPEAAESAAKGKAVVVADVLSLAVVSENAPDRDIRPSLHLGDLTSDPAAAVNLFREARPRRVVLLAFVSESRTEGKSKPKVTTNRLRVTLEEADDGWLVAGLDAL